MGIESIFQGVFGAIGAAINDIGVQGQARLNIAEANRAAALEDINAADAYRQGALAAARARMKGSEAVQMQRLAYTANGIDSTSGTAAQVAAGTGMWAELDARQAENNAARAAFGHKETGRRYRVQAQQIASQADAAHVASFFDITGSSLQAMGGIASLGMG